MFRSVLAVCGAALVWVCLCDRLDAAEIRAKTIALANCGAATAGVLEQVRQFVEKELHVPVRCLDAKAVEATDLEGCAKQLAALKGSGDVCIVGLTSSVKDASEHLRVEPTLSVAVVNAKAFVDADPGKTAERLRKATLRATAFLFGIRPSPDPRCVTHRYKTLEDFDGIGVNLCPPWQVQFEERAVERGLVVSKVSREQVQSRGKAE